MTINNIYTGWIEYFQKSSKFWHFKPRQQVLSFNLNDPTVIQHICRFMIHRKVEVNTLFFGLKQPAGTSKESDKNEGIKKFWLVFTMVIYGKKIFGMMVQKGGHLSTKWYCRNMNFIMDRSDLRLSFDSLGMKYISVISFSWQMPPLPCCIIIQFLINYHRKTSIRIFWYCRMCLDRLMFLQGVPVLQQDFLIKDTLLYVKLIHKPCRTTYFCEVWNIQWQTHKTGYFFVHPIHDWGVSEWNKVQTQRNLEAIFLQSHVD